MIKVVIADPHPVMRAGIKNLLLQANPRFRIAAQVSNGKNLLSKLLTKKPNLLIAELDMDGMDFSIIREASEQLPQMKILIFSCYPAVIYEKQCLKAGAHAFLSKNIGTKSLTSSIQKILSGNYTNLRTKAGQKRISDKKPLSAREIEVLQLLIKGHRNKDIAATLELNEKTVSTYKSRLLQKLEMENLADLITHYEAVSFANSHHTLKLSRT